MKKINYLLVTLFPILIFSQSLTTKEVKRNMSKGSQTGIEIFIPKVSEDQVEDAIKEVTKKFKGNNERVRRSDETYIDNAIINDISDNTVDMHQLVEEVGQGIRYTAFFDLGGLFLDSKSNAEKFTKAEEIVTNIAIYASKLRINELLEEETDKLENLVDDQEDLVDDKEDAFEDIEKAKEEIAEKEKLISELNQKLDSKRIEVDKQQKKLEEIKRQKALLKK